MKIILLVSFYLLLGSYSFGQSINGLVEDYETGEPLVGASVYLIPSGKGTSSNSNGYFTLTPSITDSLVDVKYIGYDKIEFKLNDIKPGYLKVRLKRKDIELTQIEVGADRTLTKFEIQDLKIMDLNREQSIPSFGGELNILKRIESLPGVSSDQEFVSGFSVRGGEYDQNLILIDGIQIYNPTHFLGLTSTFDPNAIRNVSFYKGYVPPNYGGKLSSVVDISLKEGNKTTSAYSGSISMINTSGLIEQPLPFLDGSVLVSARRSYYDIFLNQLGNNQQSNNESEVPELYFYDLYLKTTLNLYTNHKLQSSFFYSKDVFSLNKNANFNWTNFVGSIKYLTVFSEKYLFSANLYTSQYQNDLKHGSTRQSPGIHTYGLSFDQEWIENDLRLSFFSDYNISNLSINTGLQNLGNTETYKTTVQSFTLAEETSYDYWNFNFRGGARAIYKTNLDRAYFEPRAQITWNLTEKSNISLSGTVIHQFMHTLNTFNNVTFGDVLYPASTQIPPQKSKQSQVSYFSRFGSDLELTCSLFYREFSNLIKIRDYFISPYPKELSNKILFGSGESKGVELGIEKSTDEFDFRANYTLSSVANTFPKYNNGNSFTPKYSRKHIFNFDFIFKLTGNQSISTELFWATGSRLNLPDHIYQISGKPEGSLPGLVLVSDYGRAYQFETNSSFRINLGYVKSFHFQTWKMDLFLNLYNLTGHDNPTVLDVDPNNFSIMKYSVGFFPSIGIKFRI
ncbi:MAG: TonB-dependent receptor [Bacteroidetes bacterium]|nr:TonB-dependent receptor [Bacteroidota bacterium]